LVDRGSLIGDHHTADHHGSAVVNKNLGLGRLRVQARLALHADTLINLGVLHVDVQENRALGRDLRGHFQLQNGVHVLRGNRVIDVSLDRNLLTLFHGQFLVVLRDALGFREDLSDSATLHQA